MLESRRIEFEKELSKIGFTTFFVVPNFTVDLKTTKSSDFNTLATSFEALLTISRLGNPFLFKGVPTVMI